MINHARTLLLNSTSSPGAIGEEFIPSDYQVRTLPAELSQLHTILVGGKISREAKNYRVRQLMTLIHGSELAKYVYQLDPRVTYWPTTDRQCFNHEPRMLVPLAKIPEVAGALKHADLEALFANPGPEALAFWSYWNDSKQPQYRLGALTLSVIYRINQLK